MNKEILRQIKCFRKKEQSVVMEMINKKVIIYKFTLNN